MCRAKGDHYNLLYTAALKGLLFDAGIYALSASGRKWVREKASFLLNHYPIKRTKAGRINGRYTHSCSKQIAKYIECSLDYKIIFHKDKPETYTELTECFGAPESFKHVPDWLQNNILCEHFRLINQEI